MTRIPLKILLVVVTLIFGAGCSDRGADPMDPVGGPDPVSFSADVQPIFDSNCIGCHGQNGNGGQDLRAENSYANLVGVDATGGAGKRVVADDPESSVLYLKMTGAPGVGSVMPPTGGLPAEVTDIVRQWVAEGALDN
jgi:mono/diheme cytochrome c family protein